LFDVNLDIGDVVGTPVDPTDPTDPTDPDTSDDPAELLQQAEELFVEAEQALADGDLGEYQAKVDEAKALVAKALELLEG
jgi:hypothetical protein